MTIRRSSNSSPIRDSLLDKVVSLPGIDKRLGKRVSAIGRAWSKAADLSFPKALTPALLERIYRYCASGKEVYDAMMAGQREATLQSAQAAGGLTVAVHDTSELRYSRLGPHQRLYFANPTSNSQAFNIHTTMLHAFDAENTPLGVLNMQPFVHQKDLARGRNPLDLASAEFFWDGYGGRMDNETRRWDFGIWTSDRQLKAAGIQAVHVCDRENDQALGYEMALENDILFVQRIIYSRHVMSPSEQPLESEAASGSFRETVERVLECLEVEAAPVGLDLPSPKQRKKAKKSKSWGAEKELKVKGVPANQFLLKQGAVYLTQVSVSERYTGKSAKYKSVHPDREKRLATLEVRAGAVSIRVAAKRPEGLPWFDYSKPRMSTMNLNLVHVRERLDPNQKTVEGSPEEALAVEAPPSPKQKTKRSERKLQAEELLQAEASAPSARESEKKAKKTPKKEVKSKESEVPQAKLIEWVILTNLPIETEEDVRTVVDIYRSRWLIERYFHVLKSGFALEERRTQSVQGMLNLLALAMPLATDLFRLRFMAEIAPNALVKDHFTPEQVIAVNHFRPEDKITGKSPIGEMMLSLGKIGGYQPNEDYGPGWKAIYDGLRKVREFAEAYAVGRESLAREYGLKLKPLRH